MLLFRERPGGDLIHDHQVKDIKKLKKAPLNAMVQSKAFKGKMIYALGMDVPEPSLKNVTEEMKR